MDFDLPLVGRAAGIVSYLPDEMIKYELETQGIRSGPNVEQRRKQLSEVIDSRRYVFGKQPVAMGYPEDIETCEKHISSWETNFNSDTSTLTSVHKLAARLRFLLSRISRIVVEDSDEIYKARLSELKFRTSELKMKSNATVELLMLDFSSLTKKPYVPSVSFKPTTDVNNWSMPNNDMSFLTSPKSPKQNVSTQRSTQEDSALNFSLSLVENEDTQDKANRTKVVESTRNQPRFSDNVFNNIIPQPQFVNPDPFQPFGNQSYRLQIWKWGLKFWGTPNTIGVVEFLRRVKEHARARGATKATLFESASDLFDGSALLWYRAGLEKGILKDWDDIERELSEDFKAYDYGDCLWDHIRNRLQKPNERIVIFFAEMQDLFLKLNSPASELVQIKTIRRNLRPEFIRGLGVMEFDSVEHLKYYCKCIESDIRRIHSRERMPNSKEPEISPLSRQNRYYNDKIHAISDDRDIQHSHSSNDNFVRQSYDDRFHYNSNANCLDDDRYADISADQWNRSMRELSVRDEPNSKFHSVPHADNFHDSTSRQFIDVSKPPPAGLFSSQNPNSNSDYVRDNSNKYYSLQRSNNPSVNQGNANGSPNTWTHPTPKIIRRP